MIAERRAAIFMNNDLNEKQTETNIEINSEESTTRGQNSKSNSEHSSKKKSKNQSVSDGIKRAEIAQEKRDAYVEKMITQMDKSVKQVCQLMQKEVDKFEKITDESYDNIENFLEEMVNSSYLISKKMQELKCDEKVFDTYAKNMEKAVELINQNAKKTEEICDKCRQDCENMNMILAVVSESDTDLSKFIVDAGEIYGKCRKLTNDIKC